MPELPEVESLRRSLEPHLCGRVLHSVEVHFPKLRWDIPEAALVNLCKDKPRLRCIERRAKYLIFQFDNDAVLISHLGMSGQWLVDERFEAGKHMHVVLHFEGKTLVYRDPRRFGMLDISSTTELSSHPRLIELGPEPLSEAFSTESSWPLVSRAKVSIKVWLMNAKNVVGVGNIYASEALFLAGIRPTIRAGRIQKYRISKLIEIVKQVIAHAIDSGGTTLQDYRNADGDVGGFQKRLQVYGREGEPCYVCGALIKKVVLGQRSTFYCPRCRCS